jgi:hypothetical protein
MPSTMCPHGYVGDAISQCLRCGGLRRMTPGGGFGETVKFSKREGKVLDLTTSETVVVMRKPKLPTKLAPRCTECDWGFYEDGECDYCGHRQGTTVVPPAKLISARPIKLP